MKKKYYWIAGIIIVALLAFIKYDYDRREKEKARIEKLNNDVRNAAESGRQRFNESFKPVGETVVDGLRDTDIKAKSGED